MFGATVRVMSDRELRRLEMMQDLIGKDRRPRRAAARARGRRDVRPLNAYHRVDGLTGLIWKRRDRRSNGRKPERCRALYRERQRSGLRPLLRRSRRFQISPVRPLDPMIGIQRPDI